MEFFTTPTSKNIIATLRIATIEKSELTFLLILHFHYISGKLISGVQIRKGSPTKNPKINKRERGELLFGTGKYFLPTWL